MAEKISRQQKAALTKKSIFISAVNLIKQKGFDNVCVEDICKAANVAKGTFYVHYRAKEDIIASSYYQDMNEYMMENFNSFLSSSADASPLEKLSNFLNLELSFCEFIGYEITALAYKTNFSACLPGPSLHQSKREFSNVLRELIAECIRSRIFDEKLSLDFIFLYLESAVRGIMASWCLNNADFQIKIEGAKILEKVIAGIKDFH